MLPKTRTALIIALVLLSTVTFAQSLYRAQALEDLTTLRAGIHKYNPALYSYNPDFDEKSQLVLDELSQDSLSKFECFTLVSEICALSNEGHFAMGDWSDTIHRGIPNNTYKYLPIAIKIIAEKIYIWEEYSSEQSLTRGDELVSINGMAIAEIIAKLRKVTPSDGHITTWTDRSIEIGFSWIHYFFIERPVGYNITTKNAQGELSTASIKALTKEEQTVNYRKYLAVDQEEKTTSTSLFYDLRHEESYSLLRLPSFDYRVIEEEKIKSKKFYASIFEELNSLEVNNLVIDLRDNTGGRNEFADDIVPHIMKLSNSDEMLKKSFSWDGKEKVHKLPKPSKEVFQGKIYALVNGRTYSAGSTLARYLNEYGDATIVGMETGTRYEGFSAGSKQYITLPNTEVRIGIPRYHTLFPQSKKQTTSNRGLIPHYKIEPTFEDLDSERDLHLEKVIELIKEWN